MRQAVGLETPAYSRPEGERQINWSWDVCFLRVKSSGVTGDSWSAGGRQCCDLGLAQW
jgi:hypothetical protein